MNHIQTHMKNHNSKRKHYKQNMNLKIYRFTIYTHLINPFWLRDPDNDPVDFLILDWLSQMINQLTREINRVDTRNR